MDSNYVKELEEEIKKRKAENEFQFNLANIENCCNIKFKGLYAFNKINE